VEACSRKNVLIQAATPISGVSLAGPASTQRDVARRSPVPAGLLRVLGALGLLGVVASVALLSAGAAGEPTQFVPARSGGWPGWLSGPLSGLGLELGDARFQTLMLVLCGAYVLVLVGARTLPGGALAATIVLAHVLLLLGPPLLSQDVFGYMAYGRMGALHGLDPYTHFPSEAAFDPIYPFVGWPFQHSPYGPLFTLVGYATAPLGLAGGLWAFKGLACVASLGAVALIARAASLEGRSARWTAAFVGLNPVLLALAVGGAHNDTLLLLATGAALLLTAGARPRPRAAAATLVAGVGVKLTAGLMLPFAVLGAPRGARAGAAWSALLGLVVLSIIGVLGFGVHVLGFLDAVREQQQLVAVHSIPAETARLFGLNGTPAWWRHLFLAAFAVVVAVQLVRTARGADWRVAAGWSTLALLLCTAWLLPWYAIWLLPLAAVSGDRRLLGAALLFCAYAVLIHMSLADPVLAPVRHRAHIGLHIRVPDLRHRLELTGFEILRHVQLDLRW
jgi:hypothetical protein